MLTQAKYLVTKAKRTHSNAKCKTEIVQMMVITKQ